MTKRDLVVRISEETGVIQQDVVRVIQKTLDHITEALLEGKNVELRKFGVFEVQTRKPRIGRNPHKPENQVVIPERKVVKFKMGKVMRDKITRPSMESAKIAAPPVPPATPQPPAEGTEPPAQ